MAVIYLQKERIRKLSKIYEGDWIGNESELIQKAVDDLIEIKEEEKEES